MRFMVEIEPGEPGARGWTKRYGEALLRVRVYHDEVRLKRVLSVELVVEESELLEPTAPVSRGPVPSEEGPPVVMSEASFRAAQAQRSVFVRLEQPTPAVLAALQAAGAQFHEGSRCWVLARHKAEALGLALPQLYEWIVETLPEPLPVGLVGDGPPEP